MRWYPVLSVLAAAGAVLAELSWLRTGLFRDRCYWISLAIVAVFMIPIDGWMSKTSDPIVIYNVKVLSGVRFPWDIPVEEFVYAFALLTLTMLLWDRAGRRGRARADDEAAITDEGAVTDEAAAIEETAIGEATAIGREEIDQR